MLVELKKTRADPANAAITQSEAEAMARATVNLFDRWALTDAEARQLLGGMPARTWARWKSGEIGRIDRDLATRMSLLMGIHKALRHMFSEPSRGYAWLRRPNEAFDGGSALQLMLGGSIFDLSRLRSYLDAERGGW